MTHAFSTFNIISLIMYSNMLLYVTHTNIAYAIIKIYYFYFITMNVFDTYFLTSFVNKDAL